MTEKHHQTYARNHKVSAAHKGRTTLANTRCATSNKAQPNNHHGQPTNQESNNQTTKSATMDRESEREMKSVLGKSRAMVGLVE
jgi:hypothetical protein